MQHPLASITTPGEVLECLYTTGRGGGSDVLERLYTVGGGGGSVQGPVKEQQPDGMSTTCRQFLLVADIVYRLYG